MDLLPQCHIKRGKKLHTNMANTTDLQTQITAQELIVQSTFAAKQTAYTIAQTSKDSAISANKTWIEAVSNLKDLKTQLNALSDGK